MLNEKEELLNKKTEKVEKQVAYVEKQYESKTTVRRCIERENKVEEEEMED